MNQSKENKSRWRLVAGLKLFIAAGALFFIWTKVFQKESIQDVLVQFNLVFQDGYRRFLLLAALLLMPVNWLAEAVKWRMVIQKMEGISLLRSAGAVLTGLTVSFFTPNRVGEYAGRVMYLSKGNRIKGTLLTVIENMAQLVVTLVLGAAALPVFLYRYARMPLYVYLSVLIVSVCFAVLVVALFLRTSSIHKSLARFSFFKKHERFIHVTKVALPGLLLAILGLSWFRFLVFSGQLYLLLLVFGVQVDYPSAMLMIILTFFVMTLIPTFAFADLGVRGAAGTFFFAYITSHLAGVVYATLTLWLINLALPSAAGALLLAVVSPQRKESHGQF